MRTLTILLTILALSMPTYALEISVENETYIFKDDFKKSAATFGSSFDYSRMPEFTKNTDTVFENGIANYKHRILVNKHTGNEVMMSGKIKVKFSDATNAQQIANKYDINITDTFNFMNWAYFEPNMQDLFVLEAKMKEDSDIIMVHIDLIKNEFFAQ